MRVDGEGRRSLPRPLPTSLSLPARCDTLPHAVGRSPMHTAAQNNHLDVLRTLITPNHDWTTCLDSLGCTPLHLASVHGHLEAAKLLVKEGCPVNYKNQFGNTGLHEAAYRGNTKLVKFLLSKKADKNYQNQDGNQAIHLACQNGHLEVVKILLKAGAEPNLKNLIGDSCVHICVRYNQLAAFRLLTTSAFCKVDEPNAEKNSPLHIAVQYNRRDFVAALLDIGARPNTRNQQGETPVDIANRLGYDDLLHVSGGGGQQLIKHDHHPQSKHQQEPAVAQQQQQQTSGMKSFLRAATGRSASSTKKSDTKEPPSAPPPTAVDTGIYDDTKGAKGRSRSRGGGGGRGSPTQLRKRTSAIEHENSPGAAGVDQPLSLDIPDCDGGGGGAKLEDEQQEQGSPEVRRARRHKSKGKVPRKYVYDRGVYRKSKRLGASMSSLSTIDHHNHDLDPPRRRHHRGESAGKESGLYTVYDEFLKPESGRPRTKHRTHRLDNDSLHKDSRLLPANQQAQCGCGCPRQVVLLDAKVDYLKEAILDELRLSEQLTERKLQELECKMSHQVTCLDKLCRERLSAERTECTHRIDRRAMQERVVHTNELAKLETRVHWSLKAWCEARYRRVNHRLAAHLDDLLVGGGQRRHSCSDVDPRSSHDESANGGYRDSGAFEAGSKASSSGDYHQQLHDSSVGTTPSEHGYPPAHRPGGGGGAKSPFAALDEVPAGTTKLQALNDTVFNDPDDSCVEDPCVPPALQELESMKGGGASASFAALALPPLFSQHKTGSTSAYNPGLPIFKPNSMLARSGSTSGHVGHSKLSLSPLAQQKSCRLSNPSYHEVSAQLKAIQFQAARQRDSGGDSSGTGSLHESCAATGDGGLSARMEDLYQRKVTDLEQSMKRQSEADQEALRQRIRALESQLKSYQPSTGEQSKEPDSSN